MATAELKWFKVERELVTRGRGAFWAKAIPWKAFPSARGVYVWFVREVAIYVAATEDLQARMKTHKMGRLGKVAKEVTHVLYTLTQTEREAGDLVYRLVHKLHPRENGAWQPPTGEEETAPVEEAALATGGEEVEFPLVVEETVEEEIPGFPEAPKWPL